MGVEMRLHLPALPGQPALRGNQVCAFTGKVVRFAEMMAPRGHEVLIYGDPREDTVANEYVPCYPQTKPPAFTAEGWHPYNQRAAEEIAKRSEPGDILALIGGVCQAPLAAMLPELIPVEFGIGYPGSFAPYRVFESYAWMNATYGREAESGIGTIDPGFYDAVIPGYFDPADFPLEREDMGYLLFVGRLIERKGIEIAVETAKRVGMPILLAGEGDYRPGNPYTQYIGNIPPAERNKLMAGASALLAPTTYSEPFGNIVPEAGMNGCPVITTDFGAFPETVIHGKTGYRCRTMGEFTKAVELCHGLDSDFIRANTQANYGYDAIAPKYEAYFDQLTTLYSDGFYTGWQGLTQTHRYGRLL